MEPGLYITFLSKDEPPDRELPPVGPLDLVVLRDRRLVAERRSVHQAEEPRVPIDRWLEAELELRRATGDEPGGTRRQDMRVTAHDRVFVRFTLFGEAGERDAAPELGPFTAVTVGPRSVEADGRVLATRAAGEVAPWELTSEGSDAAAVHKPDVEFRTATGVYHATAEPRTGATLTPPAEPEPLFKPGLERRTAAASPAPPPAPVEEPTAHTQTDLEQSQRLERERIEEQLRARFQEEDRRHFDARDTGGGGDAATTQALRDRPEAAGGAERRGSRRRLRLLGFAIVLILLIGAGAYAVLAMR